jgi:anhydro-N-acetylmuramic acid kinase
MKIIGMISGTSFDGIDVACCDITHDNGEISIKQIGFISVPYADELHDRIANAMPPRPVTFEEVCILDTFIGQAFADAALQAMKQFNFEPDLIVSHGQTLFHWIDETRHARGTLQIGEPTWITEKTGVAVLSNTRARDVAAGGHGAPLVSLLDDLLFGGYEKPQGALNLGGISNITIACKGMSSIAYDIGPANGLLDAAIYAYTKGEKSYDHNGEIAASGKIDSALLAQLLNDPYYALPAPKSTGKELFHLEYLIEKAGPVASWNFPDLMATLVELTVLTVAHEVEKYMLETLYIAGGGSANPFMVERLQSNLPRTRVASMSELNVDPRAKEGVTFALIGFLSAHGLPGQVPSATGARGERILGSFSPGSKPLVLPTPITVKPTRVKLY